MRLRQPNRHTRAVDSGTQRGASHARVTAGAGPRSGLGSRERLTVRLQKGLVPGRIQVSHLPSEPQGNERTADLYTGSVHRPQSQAWRTASALDDCRASIDDEPVTVRTDRGRTFRPDCVHASEPLVEHRPESAWPRIVNAPELCRDTVLSEDGYGFLPFREKAPV